MRFGGKSGVVMLMTATLILTSCQGHLSSSHRVKLPVHTVVPFIGPCRGVDLVATQCIYFLYEEYQEMVLELKQACIAGGYELEDCK